MGKLGWRALFDGLAHTDSCVIEVAADASRLFAEDASSTAPLRTELSTTKDLSFIVTIVAALAAQGLSSDEAQATAALVLLQPTLALYSKGKVLQSVVVAAVEGSAALTDPTRITVTGTIAKAAWGASMSDIGVSVEPFDLTSDAEVASLVCRAATDYGRYPMPPVPRKARFTVMLLGNPLANGAIADLDLTWDEQLRSLGVVLNVDLQIVTSRAGIHDAFPASTKLTVAFDPGLVGQAKKIGQVPQPDELVCGGRNVSALVVHVAELILAKLAEADDDETPISAVRTLQPGDEHFYRKQGNSASFDKFTPTTPCSHDVGWIRYMKAPKATKGMHRIYTNFEDDMLHHCARGYGCNVYAVFAPANRQGT
jgi:hypothetical protein